MLEHVACILSLSTFKEERTIAYFVQQQHIAQTMITMTRITMAVVPSTMIVKKSENEKTKVNNHKFDSETCL